MLYYCALKPRKWIWIEEVECIQIQRPQMQRVPLLQLKVYAHILSIYVYVFYMYMYNYIYKPM